ncbi:MAG TPA: cell division protein FtsQ/DivIB [Casimicrobiaceae bacterium]|nr:cell division protein FtsQ/DivIB [Casimicrobiaceae bacterium]
MWDDARALNTAAAVIAIAALVLLAWGATTWAVRQPVFDFREVVIKEPLSRANPAFVEAVIREELKGTFFTMRLGDARASLSRVPWVRDVSLRRLWPGRLEVSVSEHEPLARWNDSSLVNSRGEVFGADYDGELPQFVGPEGAAAEVTARFREFGEMLKPANLAITEISRSPRGGWRVSTGRVAMAIELGRVDPGERLSRFVANYARTVGRLERAGKHVSRVDLRYGNGFAATVQGLGETVAKQARPDRGGRRR